MYKNIEKQKVLQLKDLVEYQDGQVVRAGRWFRTTM